ncbi:ral guanine nucleotide dissociation stimulator-like 2 isoform X5 [Pelodiscus sinensis]|uniref:ral guanine nucleotide dissociation stimulator-like 2 isoform X5 n=1 Tax=Pelodiscus sinensis TaxID=13735 RepID=UPI003F6B01F8
MLPRSLRHLLEGARLELEGDQGVTLSAFRSWSPDPPQPQPPVTLTEEAEEGVTYTVTVRQPGAPGGGTPCRALKAGLLPRLVRHLLEARALGDATYVPAFLATCRTFARPPALLQLLLHRLEEVGALEPNPVPPETSELQRTFSSVLCSWLDGYPEDFGEALEPELAERLLRSLQRALGKDSEAERRLLALRGALGGPGTGGAVPAGGALPVPGFALVPAGQEGAGRGLPQRPRHRAPVQPAGGGRDPLLPGPPGPAPPAARPPPGEMDPRGPGMPRPEEFFVALRHRLCPAVQPGAPAAPHLGRDRQQSYEELSAICSEQDNYSLCRQLLFQGVVPYLGTFLRDLVMLDAAMKDELENGYINFEKRRKEFEVLAQLRLLQSVCRNYRIPPSPGFPHWLRTLAPLSEAQSHSLSCEIEPPSEAPAPQRPVKPTLVITHCTELLSSVGSPLISWDRPSSSSEPPTSSCDLLLPPCGPSQLLCRLAQHMKWPSVSALDTAPSDTAPSAGGLSPPTPAGEGLPRGHRRSASCGSAFPTPPTPAPGGPPSDCLILRARMDLHNGSLYKSILVTSQDKTPAVVAKVLEKHGQEPRAAPQFQLVQLLPEGKELTFHATDNVFYAMNSSSLDFVLRPKGPGEPPPPPSAAPRRPELSATFPKIKATGRKLARALF